MPPTGSILAQIYDNNKDEDGFYILHIQVKIHLVNFLLIYNIMPPYW